MTSFYDCSVPVDKLELYKVYVVYELKSWRVNKAFFKGELVNKNHWYPAVYPDVYSEVIFRDIKFGYVFRTRDYDTVTIKTLEEHRDFVRGGYQTIVSKLYEEKTGQSGNPDSGPTGLICNFIIL